MATRVTGHEFPPGGNSKYPWDEWLDGNTWQLTPGEDFTVPAAGFRTAATYAARRRHGTIRSALENGHLYLKFTKDDA